MNPDRHSPRITFPSVDSVLPAPPSSRIEVEADTVHVWGFTLESSAAVLEAFCGYLDGDERARSARFIQAEHQSQYILAHGGLRALLARYSGRAPSALRFMSGGRGKPSLLDEQGHPHAIRFNLSHSHGRMLIAVASGQEVGADVEQVRKKVEAVKLAERYYAPSECQQVLRGLVDEQASRFYRYWVAKEAVLKGQGIGITSLQDCEIVTADDGAVHSTVRSSQAAQLQSGWSVWWLDCGRGWQGAVSRAGSDWRVRVMTASPDASATLPSAP